MMWHKVGCKEGNGVFRGQHKHTIDEKGRLSIPAKFREALETVFEAPLFVTVLEQCLVAYPADEWRALEQQLNEKHPRCRC